MTTADAEQEALRAEVAQWKMAHGLAVQGMADLREQRDEWVARAEAAEAEVERLREGAASSGIHWAQEKRRAEDAESALAAERAARARVEALADSLDILARLPIEERPDGLTATQKACGALAGDLRAALAGPAPEATEEHL